MAGSAQDKEISVNTVIDFLSLSKFKRSLILTVGVTFVGQGFGGQTEQCLLFNLHRYGTSVIFSTEHGGNKLSQWLKFNSNKNKIISNTNLIGKVKECILKLKMKKSYTIVEKTHVFSTIV